LNTQQQITPLDAPQYVITLYDRYAGMLLGYIYEIVKDRQLAEDYTADVFARIAHNGNHLPADSVWLQLKNAAKTRLAPFYQSVAACDDYSAAYMHNNHVVRMSSEQRNVFCAVYYHNKTTAQLAAQFNKPESEIRKTLKEAFAFIKQRREH
jgi:DNA-directed RNA polymerase specialized sigma24 family protein